MRVILWILLGVVALAGAALAWLALRSPDQRPPSAEKVEATPERLARGEYLTLHVTHCLGCHSDFHADRFAIPIKAGTEGQGGFLFDAKLDVPGQVQAQNITSDPETGLGGWTDGEILRATREGVDRKGDALFPMMPYEAYREMSDEDARAIVAYIRTLKPIHHAVTPKRLDFPVNLLVKFAPKPVTSPIATPAAGDGAAYGKYLATIAGCRNCHTPTEKGKPIPGQEYTGGFVFLGPWGRVVSPNLTPDPENYMGQATRDEFIARFKSFESFTEENSPVAPPGRNTVMAWPAFAGMTNQDLGAIYDFLKTLPPVKKKIVAFPDAAPAS